MNKKVEALKAEFDKITESVAAIHNRALESNTDLTEQDEQDIATMLTRADEIKPLVEAELTRANKLTDVAAVFARVNGVTASAKEDAPKADAKKYMSTLIRSHLGDRNASEHLRALDVVESGTSAGLIPYTIQGDIINFSRARRQTINSLQNFPVPNGSSFKRRVLTSGTTMVDAQGSENTEVATGYPTVAYVDVTPATYAGGIRLSLQALNDTSPNAADLWLQDVTTAYANKTNTVVAAALKAAATTTASCNVSGATASSVMRALMTASDLVLSNYGEEADTIWVSTDVKTWLATLAGSDGHLVFPIINPNNRDGSVARVGSLNSGLTIGGLNVVVEPHFASSTFIVGNSRGGEVYESMYPTIEAWNVPTLAKEIAIAGELATYFRAEAFVEMVDNDGSIGATPNFG
jgi:HK97 family phage major capsid protein